MPVSARARSPARQKKAARDSPPRATALRSPRTYSKKAAPSRAVHPTDGVRLRVYHVVFGVIAGASLATIYWHTQVHQRVNWLQAVLAVFLVLNTFICYCELQLTRRADYIVTQYFKYEAEHRGSEHNVALAWFLTPLTLQNATSDVWASMWSAYALFDPCYANDESHGFWVDTGNGYLTLLPSLLLLCGMTVPLGFLSARWLGVLSMLIFWTEWLGTVIYMVSYFYRGRLQLVGWRNTLLFVACTNGIWFVVPMLGMYASAVMIDSDSIAIFQ